MTTETRRMALADYNEQRYGPLLGVSDEGSAAGVIARAVQECAKARAVGGATPDVVGLIIDGERMTSAGEVPIGPLEYASILEQSRGITFSSTNVGVRLNARHYQPLPEFDCHAAGSDLEAWCAAVFAVFRRFLETPDGVPRPLTVRLRLSYETAPPNIGVLIERLEAGRRAGQMADAAVHRLTLLLTFEGPISGEAQVARIRELIDEAARCRIPEVALDADLVPAARLRLGVQGVLNVLQPGVANELLGHAAGRGVALVYRYQFDAESAARTIWTGLYTAQAYGMSAAKYGLVPLTLEEQQRVIQDVQLWIREMTPIPAFYADTPLVTVSKVFLTDRATEALDLWISMAAQAGASVVLVDCPDRITPRIDVPGQEAPRRLVAFDGPGGKHGIFKMADIARAAQSARQQGVRVLWSGGIRAGTAYELGQLGVFGVFTTSSTARPIRVGDVLASDWQLAAEQEPTFDGVRRVHALLQAGFLEERLRVRMPTLASRIAAAAQRLIATDVHEAAVFEQVLAALDDVMVTGWRTFWGSSEHA